MQLHIIFPCMLLHIQHCEKMFQIKILDNNEIYILCYIHSSGQRCFWKNHNFHLRFMYISVYTGEI
jgi:hypothetical protein